MHVARRDEFNLVVFRGSGGESAGEQIGVAAFFGRFRPE